MDGNETQQGGMMSGMITPQVAQASLLLKDIAQGKQQEQICDKVGKTLPEVLYTYQCDQASSFIQVSDEATCSSGGNNPGVGFVRLNYVAGFDHILSSSLTDDSLATRIKDIKAITEGIADDKIQSDGPRIEQLQLLLQSIQSSVQQGDTTNIEQRLEFDFPSSTDIIVDPKCRSLKRLHRCELDYPRQFIMPLSEANAYFELRGPKQVTVGGEFTQYADDADATRPTAIDKPD